MRVLVFLSIALLGTNSFAKESSWLCQAHTLSSQGELEASQVLITPSLPEVVSLDGTTWVSSSEVCQVPVNESELNCQTQDQSMALVQRKKLSCTDQSGRLQVEAHVVFAPGTQNGRVHCRHDGQIWSLELTGCQEQESR